MRAPTGLARSHTRAQDRALRALSMSGRRLEPRGEKWAVMGSSDRRRRPLAEISRAELRMLEEDGTVRPAMGGYVLADAGERESVGEDGRSRADAGPPSPTAWMAAGLPRACSAVAAGFVGLAERARRGEGPMSSRAALAGLKLVSAAERAASGPGMSMNWDAVAADRGARRAGSGPGEARLRAMREVAYARVQVTKRRNEAAWRCVWSACVEGRSLRQVEVRMGLRRGEAARRLCAALEALADSYDGR
ncbi:MAG: DUF6456 domain-containing protein [Hyphomonadaceae bacterium]